MGLFAPRDQEPLTDRPGEGGGMDPGADWVPLRVGEPDPGDEPTPWTLQA